MPELLLTARARRDVERLPPPLREAVDRALTLLASEPAVHGKELLGRLRGLWSARVGSYRILYTIEGRPGRTRVIVRSVRHRAVAYPRGRRR